MRIAVVIVALLGLSACNTMEGFGRDVESGGEAISDTADDVEGSL
jgi:predicted small secreted protein